MVQMFPAWQTKAAPNGKMLWGIYSAIYGEVNVSVEKCVEIKGDNVEKQQNCFISVTLKSWSGRKLLDPTTYIPEKRWRGHEVDHSSPRSVKVKNERRYATTSHVTSRFEQGHYLHIPLQDQPHVKVGGIENMHGWDGMFQRFGWYTCRKRQLGGCTYR